MNKHPDTWLCDETHDENASNMLCNFICRTVEQAEAFAKSVNCSLGDVIGNSNVNECLRIADPELHRNIITAVSLWRLLA